MHTTLPNSIAALREAYANGTLNPATVVQQIIEGSRAYEANNIWIQPPNAELIEPFVSVLSKDNFDALPLWGIPFAVKDNIDVAGFATTAGCSAYTYTPEQSAYCVQLLVDAGALPVGKTNLDQESPPSTQHFLPGSNSMEHSSPPTRLAPSVLGNQAIRLWMQ